MPSTYAVGVVNYRTYDDLARCLERVKAQTLAPSRIQVVDADPDPARLDELRRAHPDVEWLERPNRGFGAGANDVLRAAGAPGASLGEAVLILNPDVELAPDFCAVLLDALRRYPNVAIASGKLVRPEGVIDSAGISMPKHRRPHDRGSGELDRGQYDRLEHVFAVCGAAMMIRTAALGRLAIDGEIFDEDFFTYREDTDLCWRARRVGYEVLYVPGALATHVRRWRPGSTAVRAHIPLRVRRHSFKNHYLQLIKNEELGRWLRDLPVVLAFELARFAYVLVTDPRVVTAYVTAVADAPRAYAKRKRLNATLAGSRARPARTRVRVSTPAAVAVSAVVPTDLS